MTETSQAHVSSEPSGGSGRFGLQPIGEAALAYGRYGWHVFPCKRDKTPWTAHGWQDATADPEQIGEWWTKRPSAEIGIACGPSEIVVIDYDLKHDPDGVGRDILERLLAGAETRQAQTGSGGAHYYFSARPGLAIRNSASRIGSGIDVRGEGGYVIAPPSRNEDGAYTWLNRAPVLPLPESIAAILSSPDRPRASGTVEGGVIGVGHRNDRLTSLAGTLRRRNVSPLAIEQALLAENRTHFSVPLSDAEVLTIARSVGRYPPAEELGQDACTEPVALLLTEDSVQVSVTLSGGQRAHFVFTEMEKDRRELNSHLKLTVFGTKDPFQQRINLESSGQRTDLRRELDNLYGKDFGWSAAVNAVWSLARDTFLGQDRSARLTDIPHLVGARELIAPLMPAEGTTILFGDGSSLKSYLGLMLATASAADQPAASWLHVPHANVLYIDYEDSDTNFRRRAGRVLRGMEAGIEDAAGLHYWKARGVPLRDQGDAIQRAVTRHNIGWMIVDSAAPACGGPPEEAQSALNFFSAIARIGLPTLLIAHMTKGDTEQSRQKPFGSSFWHNLARRTWYVHRVQEEEADEVQMALYCRKVNDGPKPRPLGFEVTFEGDEGPVRFARFDINGSPGLVQHTSAQNRVWTALTRPLTTGEIAEVTDLSETMIRKVLGDHLDRFMEMGERRNVAGGRPSKLWSRRGEEDEF